MDQQMPDFRAALDQVSAALVDMAKAIAGYYVALVAAGIPHDAATALACEMQSILILGQQTEGEA